MRAPSRVNPLLQRPASTTEQCVGAGLPANTMAAATVYREWKLVSRSGPFAGKPAPTRRPAPTTEQCVGADLPANTMAAATVYRGWKLVSRSGPFAGKPAPTRRPAPTTDQCVGAGLPANTMAAATVNHGWKLVSRSGPFAGKPAPTKKPPLGAAFSLRLSSAYSCGPAALMASETSNFLKFSMNSLARPLAASS